MARTVLSTLIVIALACAPSAQAAQAPAAKTPVKASAKAQSDVQSWQADLTMKMNVQGQSVDVTGTICAKKPNRTRIEMSLSTMPQAKQVVYSDGKTVWVYLPEMNIATKIDASKARSALGMGAQGDLAGISNPLAGFPKDSIKALPDETLDKEACKVYDCKPPVALGGKLPFMPAKIKIWVSKKTNMMVGQDMVGADGNVMMFIRLSNIKVNPELADSVFAFAPPKDAKVSDMTEGAVKALKELKDKK